MLPLDNWAKINYSVPKKKYYVLLQKEKMKGTGSMELIEQLICFGMTRQEATIYLVLVTEGPLNGYEVSKHTGISRSNAYNALAGLVDKGAAYIIEESSSKYCPVEIEEFCTNKLRSMSKLKEELVKHIPKRREESNGYVTIRGKEHILNKVKNMIAGAQKRIYISAVKEVLIEIQEELKAAADRKIKVVVITEDSLWNLPETIIYYYNEKKQMQLGLIVDTMTVLTGEIAEGNDATCLYSRNKNLVIVFRDMLKNEMKLIEINRKKGEKDQ